jgi:hypothetical protein
VRERRRGTVTKAGANMLKGAHNCMWKLEGHVQVKSHRGKDESKDGR